MTETIPMYWLNQIQNEALEYKKVPLWGSAPPFPWEKFSEELHKALETSDFKIYPILYEPLPTDDPLKPFGVNPKTLSFSMEPLPGNLTWVISSESFSQITTLLLNEGSLKDSLDLRFQEGFYEFLLLQACKTVEDLKIYPNLHIQWKEEQEEPLTKTAFFIDIAIMLYERTFSARLLLSSEFQKAFASYFPEKAFDPLSSLITNKLHTFLKLEVGHCLISQKEWSTIQIGDFLILDRCSYNPETQKGVLDLIWDKSPLFKVKIKKNSLKILDYAVYTGDQNTMNENFTEDSFPEIDGEFQEHTDHLYETPEEEPSMTEPPSAKPDNLFPIQDIPFPIVVEVDRIKMSLEKLLQLKPGNILELSTHPEQGVTLTVHGKKIARGELLKIGDVLGVKILEIDETKS